MSPYPFPGAAVIAMFALALTFGACSPEKAATDEVAPAPASEPEEQGISAPPATDKAPPIQPSDPAPSVPDENKPTEVTEEKPTRLFDLVREGDRLVLSGRIRSEFQARDIAKALQIEGLTLDNQLEVAPNTPGVDWGNRINQLLPHMVTSVPDLHFHVEDGVITVTGTVKSEQDRNQLQRDIVYIMESPLIRDLKNELKIAEGEAK